MAKRIGIFSAHYMPYLGGVENYTFHLAQGLKKKGDQVVIVTSGDVGLPSYEKMDGIWVMRMPAFQLLNGRFPVSFPNGRFFGMYRRLLKIPFDLIIVNTRFYLHSICGLMLAKQQRTKAVVIDHGTSHMTIGSPFWDRMGSWYEHGITAVEKRMCKNFYGVSGECCTWLTHFGIKPKGTIYNAVNMEQMKAFIEHPAADYRSIHCIPQDGIVVTYTGRLVKEKGIRNLIQAVQQCTIREKLYLFIAGDGEEMSFVKSQKNAHVIPLGRLTMEEVGALLGQTDIYCLPTDYPEGFPTAVLEAAAAGCYVITTTRGGSKELILDDSYGMIMENNSVHAIRMALESVGERENDRREAAQRAKERLTANFTWEIIADQVHNL